MNESKLVIVLDGANICTKHTKEVHVSRLHQTFQYFKLQAEQVPSVRMQCLAFVPNYWLHKKPMTGESGNAAMETQDWDVLHTYLDSGQLILTPSHAHDDEYLIDYAMKHRGYVVTNDRFQDHIEKRKKFQNMSISRSWTKKFCIDFTFVGDEFLPNSQKVNQIFSAINLSALSSPPKAQPESLQADSMDVDDDASISTEVAMTVDRKVDINTSESKPPFVSSLKNHYRDRKDKEVQEEVDFTTQPILTKSQIDLSEMDCIQIPVHILPYLRGPGDQTLSHFQAFTGTNITLPSLDSQQHKNPMDPILVTIHGPTENRAKAIQSIRGLF